MAIVSSAIVSCRFLAGTPSPQLLSTFSSPSSADSSPNLLPDGEIFELSLDTTATPVESTDAANMMADSMSIIHAMAVDMARSIRFALCDIDRQGVASTTNTTTTRKTSDKSTASSESIPSASSSSLARTCYGGVTILYPLRQLCISPYIGEVQRQTARVARTRIAREFGIGAALRDVSA